MSSGLHPVNLLRTYIIRLYETLLLEYANALFPPADGLPPVATQFFLDELNGTVTNFSTAFS